MRGLRPFRMQDADQVAPVGGEAHGPDEWLDLASVVPRTALLAGLLARLGGPGGAQA